ncbi:MAG TPA: hypothetical protein VJM46_00565 [Candidatus Saccharimonadales bacterium]|nr:hypothetical protein [Candidatus Saccharimonadales bacterium]
MTTQTTIDIALAILNSVVLGMNVSRANKLVIVYLIPPVVLMWVHVVGNAMQEQSVGPLWARNHLHNLGVASCMMLVGLWLVPYIMRRNAGLSWSAWRIKQAGAVMTGVFAGWTLGTIVCGGYEVLMITIWREQTLAEGYSGSLDWIDMSAYAIAEAIMIINFLRVRPWVLKKAQARLDRPRGLGFY